MNFQKYSIKELETLIKVEETRYKQAVKENKEFEHVKIIYMTIKELKYAL